MTMLELRRGEGLLERLGETVPTNRTLFAKALSWGFVNEVNEGHCGWSVLSRGE